MFQFAIFFALFFLFLIFFSFVLHFLWKKGNNFVVLSEQKRYTFFKIASINLQKLLYFVANLQNYLDVGTSFSKILFLTEDSYTFLLENVNNSLKYMSKQKCELLMKHMRKAAAQIIYFHKQTNKFYFILRKNKIKNN
ncbi:hypothetical protein RFI_04076 [Reticulomyxa filosa]|uniref:Transmembrane protein n=1 Tax=Reticulomyxa filosa TaxID=46433 RepID=X6P4N4_RETFI|nr:hypothetical protein RFI_04076 [Reticulomyxa filosa]|eukprot:ETO33034.1 hypothetical protein RFI_04076 [Reticulomyxa filosa]